MKLRVWLAGLLVLCAVSSARAVFLGQEFTVSTGPSDQVSPAGAFDPMNQRYLVAWGDFRGGGEDIYGQLLTPDGALYGIEFTICTAPKDQDRPAVAYDPVNQRYFVVWHDLRNGISNYDIYGQLVSASGALVGTDISISTAASNWQVSPAVAYDAMNQRFLVVWGDYRSGTADIYGQIVNNDGSPFGTNFTISTAPNGQNDPAVAYDPVNQRYFVVWDDRRSSTNYDIYGQLINDDGTISGANFTISAATNDQWYPSVAYDPVFQRFLVVWEDRRGGTTLDIYSQLVSPDGVLMGMNISISSAPNDQWSAAVAYNPVAQRYVAVWEDWRSGTYSDIYGQALSADGTQFMTNFSISTAYNDQYTPSIVYDPVNRHFLVAWSDWRTFIDTDIYARLMLGGILTSDFPSGFSYAPYTAGLQATGGTLPYTWAVVSGVLPPGLTLDTQTGAISGTSLTPGAYSFAIQVTEATGITDTVGYNIVIFPNEQPRVSLTAFPISGPAPLTVTFTAAASDPDGSIAQYYWDFTGDEAVDLTTTTGEASFTYSSPGEYRAQVVVEDNRGAAAMTSTSITVSPPSQVTHKINRRGCGCNLVLNQDSQIFVPADFPTVLLLIYAFRRRIFPSRLKHVLQRSPRRPFQRSG